MCVRGHIPRRKHTRGCLSQHAISRERDSLGKIAGERDNWASRQRLDFRGWLANAYSSKCGENGGRSFYRIPFSLAEILWLLEKINSALWSANFCLESGEFERRDKPSACPEECRQNVRPNLGIVSVQSKITIIWIPFDNAKMKSKKLTSFIGIRDEIKRWSIRRLYS